MSVIQFRGVQKMTELISTKQNHHQEFIRLIIIFMNYCIEILEEYILTRGYFDLQRIMLELNPDLNYGLNIR